MSDIAIIAIIVSICIVAIVVVLAILIYHQMLLLNEMNKRLIIIAEESIDEERDTASELADQIALNERLATEKFSSDVNTVHDTSEEPEQSGGFDPHDALDGLE